MSSSTKNAVLIGAAIVLLVGAAGLYAWRSGPEVSLPTKYRVRAVCLETHEEFNLNPKLTEQPPFENPKTGKATVYPYWFCRTCKHRFVGQPAGDPPRLPMIPRCPKCPDGGEVGGWKWNDPDQANPAGTYELPKLPG